MKNGVRESSPICVKKGDKMAFFKIEYHSEVLKMEREVNVIYPDANEMGKKQIDLTDIPVLYLLHGMGGNHNSWQKRTNIERLLRRTNLIVVMPSTDLAWYTNTAYGMRYFDAIAKELPEILKGFFPNMSQKREKTFIAGLSMGGFGAFKLALLTNQFSYAASFSGALDFDVASLKDYPKEEKDYWAGVFGDLTDETFKKHSLAEFAKLSDKKTKFYAWCGSEDFLFEANERAMAFLEHQGFDILYKKDHGKHEWYYWNKQLESLLDWLPIGYVKEERLS